MSTRRKSDPPFEWAFPEGEVVVIMRWPIQGEEGHHSFIAAVPRIQAEAWIKDQEGEYFGPSDYYIASNGYVNGELKRALRDAAKWMWGATDVRPEHQAEVAEIEKRIKKLLE